MRVKSAPLRPGDLLRLGPVALLIEPVDADDVDLAVALAAGGEAAHRRTTAADPTDSVTPREDPRPARWVDLADSIATHLLGAFDPDVPAALR